MVFQKQQYIRELCAAHFISRCLAQSLEGEGVDKGTIQYSFTPFRFLCSKGPSLHISEPQFIKQNVFGKTSRYLVSLTNLWNFNKTLIKALLGNNEFWVIPGNDRFLDGRDKSRKIRNLKIICDSSVLRAEAVALASLRKHYNNGNCNAMLLLFHNFRFKSFLVFRSNLRPLRDTEVVLFNLTTWIFHF